MQIDIRKVRQSDAKQYFDLVNFVWRKAYSHIFPEEVFKFLEDNAENKIKNFNAKELNDETHICLVAENDNQIVAVMLGTTDSHYLHFKEQGYGDLCVLYVHPDFQGKGIAAKLKTKFVEFAKEKGFNKFVIGVLKDNHVARKVYERWGGKLDNYTQGYKKLDREYPEVFYTYEI